ncbi:hypothetical protein LINGRAHAP2_LOCUS14917 [Linum grandiflorum]
MGELMGFFNPTKT